MVYLVPKELPKMKGLRFMRSGLFLGECKKNRFEPSQSLAMSLQMKDFSQTINLMHDDQRVVRYLKGETIVLTEKEDKGTKGWHLICVNGYPLGWGKKAGLTIKNKYHSGWRMM